MKFTLHNSAFVSAPSRLVNPDGPWANEAFPIRYGLIEHSREGLILVDTGYSQMLFQSSNLHVTFYRNILRPKLIEGGDAISTVVKAGGKISDVRHIIVTHLHADHICAVRDFPNASVIASDLSLGGWSGAPRFSSPMKGFFPSLLPSLSEVVHKPTSTFPERLLPWGGMGADLFGDGSIITVDLPGHMMGHMGLFFPHLTKPILHAADVDWHHRGLAPKAPASTAERVISIDRGGVVKSKVIVTQAKALGCKITLCHDAADD
jgi:glyoxylase-like metal-dependent hydrolase (beta-lactamase superfamily II)